jgi:hypothetical protein
MSALTSYHGTTLAIRNVQVMVHPPCQSPGNPTEVKTLDVSQNKKRLFVRIVNPISGCGYTSHARADRYVRRGMAHYVIQAGVQCLEFQPENARADQAAASAKRSAQLGYDTASSSGLAPLQAVRNLPVACAPKAYIDRRNTPRRESRGRNSPVRVLVQDGVKR